MVIFINNLDKMDKLRKIEIKVSCELGYGSLLFSKDLELDFIPFQGLILKIDSDCTLNLITNSYIQTNFKYDLEESKFIILIKEFGIFASPEDYLEDCLKRFKNWTREDENDVTKIRASLRKPFHK